MVVSKALPAVDNDVRNTMMSSEYLIRLNTMIWLRMSFCFLLCMTIIITCFCEAKAFSYNDIFDEARIILNAKKWNHKKNGNLQLNL